ncbi:hypothetical protein EVAR_48222_1 [Eumeta japonica]|uniref:Uncharacterized protein n=1 Tax=Eumeta variegata TaxID=151549 RepID=A0A4C1YFS9_EUMVA|nr:hypothetical protein EVAR_48222_1 [Eumeta japonica]
MYSSDFSGNVVLTSITVLQEAARPPPAARPSDRLALKLRVSQLRRKCFVRGGSPWAGLKEAGAKLKNKRKASIGIATQSVGARRKAFGLTSRI